MESQPADIRLIVDWDAQSSPSLYKHKYGGVPSNGAALPLCLGCGEPVHLLFQIDLADPGLACIGLGDWDYLFLFSCLNCASYEDPMYYRLNHRGRDITILQQSPDVHVREYPRVLPERSLRWRTLEDHEVPLTEQDVSRLLGQEGNHQLGGVPIWIQDVERMPCLVCDREMDCLGMVDTELTIGDDGFRERGHMFGDRGILYAFVCRHCGVFAAKAQYF